MARRCRSAKFVRILRLVGIPSVLRTDARCFLCLCFGTLEQKREREWRGREEQEKRRFSRRRREEEEEVSFSLPSSRERGWLDGALDRAAPSITIRLKLDGATESKVERQDLDQIVDIRPLPRAPPSNRIHAQPFQSFLLATVPGIIRR